MRLRSRLGVALTILLAAGLLTTLTHCGFAERRPNFIIILADDLGYGDSSAYGGWIETPQMERLAAQGVRFSDFHTSGTICSPTRAGLMTGRYQHRAGLGVGINVDPAIKTHSWGIQASETTLAELLAEAGYHTAILGKWHLGYQPRYNPIHHGFQTFRGFIGGSVDYFSRIDRMGNYDWWHDLEPARDEGYLTHVLSRLAVEFIEENRDTPFFLYLSHHAVHRPIQPPDGAALRGPNKDSKKNWRGSDQDERVRRMTVALDESVGAVLDTLEDLGLRDDTIVIFLSDNGGAMHTRNTPLRGHKLSVWEGGHRVPAIASWPGRIAPGVSDEMAISLDLMPTILELAGVPVPDGLALDGVSLAPLLTRGESLGPRQFYWLGVAMRDGPWKLIAKARMKPLLFNLDEDISERRNLAAEHPERVEAMRAQLRVWHRDVKSSATPQPEFRSESRSEARSESRSGARSETKSGEEGAREQGNANSADPSG